MEKEDDGEFFASLRVGSSQEMSKTEKQLVTLEKPVREAASNWGWKKTDLFIRHRPLMQIPKQFDDAPFLQTHPNARFVTIEKYRDLFGFRVFAVIFRPGEFQLLFDNTGLKHPVAPPPAQKEKTKKKRWWKRTGSDDSKETPTTALKRYYLAPSTVSNDRTLSRRVYYTVLDRTQQRQVSIQILKHQEYITALEVADWNGTFLSPQHVSPIIYNRGMVLEIHNIRRTKLQFKPIRGEGGCDKRRWQALGLWNRSSFPWLLWKNAGSAVSRNRSKCICAWSYFC